MCNGAENMPCHLISNSEHIEDRSDEEFCDTSTCPQGYWQCADKTCIQERFVCDGQDGTYYGGCFDDSDEISCESYTCLEGFFKCGDFKMCLWVSNTLYKFQVFV